LGSLYKRYETPFTLVDTSGHRFFRILGEMFILNDEVVEVVSEVIGAS